MRKVHCSDCIAPMCDSSVKKLTTWCRREEAESRQDLYNAHVQRFRQDRYNIVRGLVWRWKLLAIMETSIKDKVFVAWAHEVLVSSSSSGRPSLVSSSSDIVQQQDDPDDASDSSSDCSTVAVLWML